MGIFIYGAWLIITMCDISSQQLSSHLSSKPMTYIIIIATLPTNIYNSYNKQSEPDPKLVAGGGICRLQY
jgi:hypothetical protein